MCIYCIVTTLVSSELPSTSSSASSPPPPAAAAADDDHEVQNLLTQPANNVLAVGYTKTPSQVPTQVSSVKTRARAQRSAASATVSSKGQLLISVCVEHTTQPLMPFSFFFYVSHLFMHACTLLTRDELEWKLSKDLTLISINGCMVFRCFTDLPHSNIY